MWTAVLLVAGCAGGFNASRLVPGQSMSGEVQKALGTPAERQPSPDGETVLWYVRDLLGPPSQDDWFPRQQRQMWAYQAQGPQQAQLYVLAVLDRTARCARNTSSTIRSPSTGNKSSP